MQTVIERELDDHWRSVPADALQRIVDMARRSLQAPWSFLVSSASAAPVLLCGDRQADPVLGLPDRGQLTALIRSASGHDIGTLGIGDDVPRHWTEDDERLLADFAALLAEQVDLRLRFDDRARMEPPTCLDAGRVDAVLVNAGPLEANPPSSPSNVSRILVADDLDLNRKLIADMLSIEGYLVDSVADGASAVRAAREQSYDLILMDMIMPGMDGVAAARAIRALPAPTGDVPIVALTANTGDELLGSCLEAGMNATLTKPMTFDALNKAVAAFMRQPSRLL